MVRPLLLAALIGSVAASCAEAPALEVSGVRYAESELLGLTEERRRALEDLTLFGAAAAAGGLDRLADPLVRHAEVRRLAELLRAQRAFDSLAIGEEALRAHYEGVPEQELTVRHLIVLSGRSEPDATREEARAKAARALERILAGEPFPEVAAEVSEEPGAEGRQGLLTPGRKGAWVQEFWNAASTLEVGGVSPVVETQYGFHVLRLEDRRVIPFEEARAAVTLEVASMIGVTPGGAPPLPAPPSLRLATDAELAARLIDPSAGDDEAAATWEGGALTLGELRDHLATLEAGAYEAVLDPARAPALSDEVATVAGWRRAADEARTLGFEPGAAHGEAVRADWVFEAQGWAAQLGFRPGAGAEAVKAAALAALGATAQNASVARSELLARAPLLRRSYRDVAEAETTAPGPA